MMVRSKGQSQPPRCERVGPLFDRFVAAPSSEVRFAVVTARWNGYGHRADAPPQKAPKEGLRRLLEFMQRKRLRILLVGPVPEFNYDGVTCILLAERYGIDHAECDVRAVVERRRARQVAMLREVAGEFPGVRYIDPIDLFCDQATCHPGRGRAIYFADSHHLSPAGADLVFQGFARDFAWASEGDAEQTANARDARSQSAPRRFP